nr:transketolase [Saprospiraceae bacterium]
MELLKDVSSRPQKGDLQEEDSIHKLAVLQDYYTCCKSREASILSRREVLSGKAKFGISGDGKELAQVALAKSVKAGDFRSGYYRDQTLMFALGHTIESYFAQLYADPEFDPYSQGRQMMSHFASPLVEDGKWTNHLEQFNSISDISCTAGQVGRAVGLGLASEKYRKLDLEGGDFSHNGDEVVICTIGDGSTSEGAFWEAVNAAAVQQLPIAFCVWDDGYSISVPKEYQTVKASISEALSGFATEDTKPGIRIYKGKAWNYAQLCQLFAEAIPLIRQTHEPALIHIEDMTQPLGHSTSGSHQRYKSAERIQWEEERDCLKAFEKWMLATEIANAEELDEIRTKAINEVRQAKKLAWERARKLPLKVMQNLLQHLTVLEESGVKVDDLREEVQRLQDPAVSELLTLGRRSLQRALLVDEKLALENGEWIQTLKSELKAQLGSKLYSEGPESALNVAVVHPKYESTPQELNGYEILNQFFDHVFSQDERVFAFGEDVGALGDVNQGFAGLQQKYGESRIFDTGIREWTIIGQAIGMALRGLRPIAEIQYIDYILYALAPLSDDLASLSYRSAGIQKAPVIIRSRGHRLEGIWHSGSPMGLLLHALRGIYICVPRNMVQAAGMYNTALQSMDPVLVIERLNAYRLKEELPSNLGEYTVPFGVPEILREGDDLTLISYGSCIPPCLEASAQLAQLDIE